MEPRAGLDEAVLEDHLSALESARSWSPRVVSRLESRIRGGDDRDLFRVNAKAYAVETAMSEPEAIDLFLHATHVGLFQMEWILVCKSCGNTARSFRGLAKIDPHFICELCQMVNDLPLDEYVQVVFTISPSVRAIRYHDPMSLSAEDLIFDYQASHEIRPGTGDALTSLPVRHRGTRLVDYIDSGATLSVAFDFTGAAVMVRDFLHAASAVYMLEPEAEDAGSTRTHIRLLLGEGGLRDEDRTLGASEFLLTEREEMRLIFPGVARLAHGPLDISVRNELPERGTVWVVELPTIPTVFEPIRFGPVLSAREVLSTQTFRVLFRSETIAASESLAIRDLTFLFTDLRDSTAMYERIGDASAYNLVRLHFDALEVVIRELGGAIVKTIGDAIMATFVDPASGVRAAKRMAERLDEFNRTSSSDLVLKMGLHRGHAIAVSSNETLDYFGQTVNIAARIQALAGPGELCLSDAIYRAEGVPDVLSGIALTREARTMKGVDEPIPVYRVALH